MISILCRIPTANILSKRRNTKKNSYFIMKRLLLLSLILVSLPLFSQIIFTESIANTIDTTRTVQGTIAPELNFKTEKENVFNFKNKNNKPSN